MYKRQIEEYQKKVFESDFVGKLFMSTAVECVREEKTLPSFFKSIPDNETGDDHEIQSVIPERVEPMDSQDQLPSEEPEESEEGLPETIFQG